MASATHAPKFANTTITPVADQHYSRVATRLISHAAVRCLCSMFIVDIKPRRGQFLVDDLLLELQSCRRRGVDVRVVVSGSNDALAILESSAVAVRRFRQLKIPVRWAAEAMRPNHSKVLVCDNEVILGSHNWSANAFRGSSQDSVLIASKELSDHLAASFERRWTTYGQ